MDIANVWVLVIVLVVVPLFFWYRVRSMNKQREGVTVRCPHCGKDQRLSRLGNYQCVKCERDTFFYDSAGEPRSGVEMYRCKACGAENFKGVITCVECGLANQVAVQ